MKDISWLLERMAIWRDKVAIICDPSILTYRALLDSLRLDWFETPIQPEFSPCWLYWLLSQPEPKVTITTSGTTGQPKPVTHYVADLCAQYREKVPTPYRMIAFLLFDHMDGINTLLRSLCSGGTLIIPMSNKVADVCDAIEKHKATCLSTTPSFLNMLLMTEMYKQYDLSSLKVISFGTEVMPEQTMDRLMKVFPIGKGV